MRKLCYKWDFETFYHNVNYELQKEVPLMVKFPGNEFGGRVYLEEVSLFDIIHTTDDLLRNNLNIARNHGSSLYSLMSYGDKWREKYRIKECESAKFKKTYLRAMVESRSG